jgi:vacuolar iron transporter family protein
MSLTWLTRLLARSPKTINEERRKLLSSDSDETIRRYGPPSDLESQASTATCPLAPADEKKSSRSSARFISDAIIGLSDGLTVPFALTAGLAALGNTRTVIFAGMAELTAGAISMGLGGYLGAKSEE